MTMKGEMALKATPIAPLPHLPFAGPRNAGRRVSPRARTAASDMLFGLVTSREGFLALRTEWQELEARSGTRFNYFQTFDWNWKWYENAADPASQDLLILTVRRNGRLAAIWPLMIVREAGLRTVKWLSEPHLQYGDVLVESNDHTKDLLVTSWNHLQRLSASYDLILLNKVLKTANAFEVLNAHCKTGINQSEASQFNVSDYATISEFADSLSKKRRRRHTKRRNALVRHGGELTFHVHEQGLEYISAVETALSFKREWLENSGLTSRSLFEPETERFLASLPSHSPHGPRAVASELKLGGKTISVELGFVFKSHYYAYLGAFDWELKNFSPGKVHMRDMVGWCIDNSISHYDLLGTPAAYKSEWSNETIEMQDFCVTGTPLAAAYARWWLGTVRPVVKSVFENLGSDRRRALLSAMGFARKLFAVG